MYYSNLLLYTTVYQHLSIIFDWYTKVMGPMVTGRSWAPWPSRVYHGFYHVLAMIWPWFICGIAVTCCYPKLDQRHEMSGFLQNRQEKYGQLLYLIVKSGKDIQKHLKNMVSYGFPVPTGEKSTRAAHGCAVRGAKQKSREMQKILQLMQQYEVLGMEETHDGTWHQTSRRQEAKVLFLVGWMGVANVKKIFSIRWRPIFLHVLQRAIFSQVLLNFLKQHGALLSSVRRVSQCISHGKNLECHESTMPCLIVIAYQCLMNSYDMFTYLPILCT